MDKGLGVGVNYRGNLNVAALFYFLAVVLAVCYIYQIYKTVHQNLKIKGKL